jgi:hypothetical protein
MGGINPNIPLMGQAPQVADPLTQYLKALQIKQIIGANALQQQQQQSGQIALQQQQQDADDQQSFRQAFKDAGGDWDKTIQLATQNGVGPQFIAKVQTAHIEQQKSLAALTTDQQAIQEKRSDRLGLEAQALLQLPQDERQQYHNQARNSMILDGIAKPTEIPEQVPDDDTLKFVVAQSKYIQTQLAAQKVAQIRASKPPEGELPLPNVDQMNQGLASRWQVLNPGKPLPPQFTLPPNATQKDFDRVDKMLTQTEQATGIKAQQDSANQMRQQSAQDRQDVRNSSPVFAFNPKTGQREQSSFGEYQSAGLTNPVKVTNADIEKETQLNSQLNDLQLNTSRFKNALNAMGPLSQTDVANMTHILSDPNVSSGILNNIGMPAVISMMEQGSKARDWNALSPDKQQALIGALRMKNSALLFQKVATGMGRASKEAMDIEIANMPSPIEGATVGNQKLQAFQENIDQMASRSVKLPGLDQSKDVKSRVEAPGVDAYNAAHPSAASQPATQQAPKKRTLLDMLLTPNQPQ